LWFCIKLRRYPQLGVMRSTSLGEVPMTIATRSLSAVAALLGLLVSVVSADAQATRTWVSGVGDDANPCSRTAPCKTFAGAISKTAAGGEINCIDPGGFGAVTITKSMTIDCSGTFGSILAGGTNGVIVNGPNIAVTLRNISINGAGTVLGLNGIRFIQSGALRVEKVKVFNFSNRGIDFAPTGASELIVRNSEIYNLGTGVGVGGIFIAPAAGVSVIATIDGTSVQNNSSGIAVDTSTANTIAALTIRDSVIAGNSGTGLSARAGTQALIVGVHKTSINSNGLAGISSDGTNSTVRIGESVVSANGTGLSVVNAGKIVSFSSNIFAGNLTSDGAATQTLPEQ
jgi:hypothetical protein